MPEPAPIKKYAAEALATFCLVFAGTGAIVINDVSKGAITHPGIALTFGLVVMAMIYAVGDVSGAHINPAVTFGFWFAGRLPRAMVLPYVVSQLVGAFAASGLMRLLFDHTTLGATHPAGPLMQSFVLEIVLTAMLMFVILGVAIGPKEKGLLAGVAIGGRGHVRRPDLRGVDESSPLHCACGVERSGSRSVDLHRRTYDRRSDRSAM
jgi:aquaporin Z